MTRKFLDYNPITGLLTSTAFEDGKNVVKYEQDVEDHFTVASRMRADTDLWKRGVKDSFAHAAFVPDVVIMDMLTRFGVNFYDKAQGKRVLQLIETEYPKCKTTDKRIA
jgi:hypothetical protein